MPGLAETRVWTALVGTDPAAAGTGRKRLPVPWLTPGPLVLQTWKPAKDVSLVPCWSGPAWSMPHGAVASMKVLPLRVTPPTDLRAPMRTSTAS
jgi:hypothetical protein